MTKQTIIKFTSTRKELCDKYFQGFDAYEKGNMGIISLLSDIQHMHSCEYSNQILNDIKCVLKNDNN